MWNIMEHVGAVLYKIVNMLPFLKFDNILYILGVI